METKHTPLIAYEEFQGWPFIAVDGTLMALPASSLEPCRPTTERNAKMIVRRYNLHPQLLEALENIVWRYTEEKGIGVGDAVEKAKKLIALATGSEVEK